MQLLAHCTHPVVKVPPRGEPACQLHHADDGVEIFVDDTPEVGVLHLEYNIGACFVYPGTVDLGQGGCGEGLGFNLQFRQPTAEGFRENRLDVRPIEGLGP